MVKRKRRSSSTTTAITKNQNDIWTNVPNDIKDEIINCVEQCIIQNINNLDLVICTIQNKFIEWNILETDIRSCIKEQNNTTTNNNNNNNTITVKTRTVAAASKKAKKTKSTSNKNSKATTTSDTNDNNNNNSLQLSLQTLLINKYKQYIKVKRIYDLLDIHNKGCIVVQDIQRAIINDLDDAENILNINNNNNNNNNYDDTIIEMFNEFAANDGLLSFNDLQHIATLVNL